MSQQARHFNEESLLDWPYVLPNALMQRIVDVAAIERIEASPAHWLPWQQQRVGELLTYVKSIYPWWDSRLGGGGADTERVRETLNHWNSVAVLTRSELLQSIEAIGEAQLAEGEDPPQPCATRGSTAQPLFMLRSAQATRLSGHLFHADHVRHGRRLDGVRAVIGDVASTHPGTHTWIPAVGELNESVILMRNAPKFSLKEHTQWLREGQIGQLTVATDFLATLVDFIEAEVKNASMGSVGTRVEPLQIGQVLSAGGAVSNELRARVKTYLGADLYDRYISEEAGPIAMQSPVTALSFDAEQHSAAAPASYNICVTNVLVEVLNPDGSHVQDGEEGSVVVTALHQFAHPVIRYALGDVARWHARCPQSGAALPSLTEIRRA